MTKDEILEEIAELDSPEKIGIFVELAKEYFPVDSWTEREINLLAKLGIKWAFGLDEDEDDKKVDFFQDFFKEPKFSKKDWL